MQVIIFQFGMSLTSSLVIVNGKDFRRSSPVNVSYGLFKCFSSTFRQLLYPLDSNFRCPS